MTDHPVPINRNGAAPARLAPVTLPSGSLQMGLSEIERVCDMIATGGDMVPPAYRNKPGAVLLAKLWADKNGVDLLTAVQNIYPIQGKPYVAAEMRVELASLKGYEIEVVESNARRCELEVTSPKGRVRRVVATMPSEPEETGEGLIWVQPAPEDLGKPNWKNRTSDMLYALACRVADRRLVRSGAALIDAAQDYTDAVDTMAIPAGRQLSPGLQEAIEDMADAELVEVEPDPEPPARTAPEPGDAPITVAELIEAAKTAGKIPAQVPVGAARKALLTVARDLTGASFGTADDLAADQQAAEELLAKLGGGQ